MMKHILISSIRTVLYISIPLLTAGSLLNDFPKMQRGTLTSGDISSDVIILAIPITIAIFLPSTSPALPLTDERFSSNVAEGKPLKKHQRLRRAGLVALLIAGGIILFFSPVIVFFVLMGGSG
jgi:hypothetical protein